MERPAASHNADPHCLEAELALETLEHGDACVVLDPEFRIIMVNAEQERLSCTPRARSLGRIAWDVWPHVADPAGTIRPALERAMRERVTIRFEARDPLHDVWLDLRAYPGANGGIAVFSQDITGRKRAEEALRAGEEARRVSEERMRAIFDDAAVGLVEVDAEDRFVAVNCHFARLLGYSREELVGRTIHEVTAPEDRDVTRELNARARADGKPYFEYEKRYLRRDGSTVWVHINVSVIRGAEGRLLRSVGTAEDITERKRAEALLLQANEQLRIADRRKDDFLGMLSHELRNPLAPIRNALFVLDHAAPDGPQARRAREIATRQVTHMTRLIDDLLDVTRIARGKVELRRAPLDLAALLRRIAEDHRTMLAGRRLDLALELPTGQVRITGDETRLAQVLGNLLHNAAKFTPAGGQVTLTLEVDGDLARLHVRDTGPGISPDVLPTIFEPFTQAEQTLARSEGGLGLGLSLVKGLVLLHGGDVTARSGGPDAGMDFVVTLPLDAPQEDRVGTPATTTDPGQTRPRHVLVIDDNRDAADSLAELVSLLGHEADVAYDGTAGLGKATRDTPDVVLCDIGLPGMDGYEVARRLRATPNDHAVRLVAVSGYAQPEDVARAVEAGFDAHVAKPPDPDRLAELLG